MICGGPHRGATTKKQRGNGAKELRHVMGEMGVRRIGGKGGRKAERHEEHGTKYMQGEFVHWKRN